MSAGVNRRPDPPAYPVRSVAKALEILLLLRDHEIVGVSQVSQQLGIARSTAHRLLRMLEHYEFARREPDSRGYQTGPVLVSLGFAAVLHMDIRRRARPHIEQLAREVQETVTLFALEGANVRFLDCVESPRVIRVSARTGLLRPAHCTSAGKAILADLATVDVERLYPDERLQALTDRSITRRSELLTALAEIRRVGYATNIGESDADLAAVGVVVPGATGAGRVGLGIAAPEARLAPAQIRRIAAAAQRTARIIADTVE